MDAPSDEQLVKDVQEGDVFAFEHLVKRYQRRLHSFVIHVVRDSDEAWDVVQESFINLYKTIDRVEPTRKFSIYLFSIARNTAISHLRAHKKEIPLEDIVGLTDDESLYERLAALERETYVREGLARLDEKYRSVIRLYYFDDLSYEEISQKLHLPINTIRTHLARAKEALKKILEIS